MTVLKVSQSRNGLIKQEKEDLKKSAPSPMSDTVEVSQTINDPKEKVRYISESLCGEQ